MGEITKRHLRALAVEAAEAVEAYIKEGADVAMNRFNGHKGQ